MGYLANEDEKVHDLILHLLFLSAKKQEYVTHFQVERKRQRKRMLQVTKHKLNKVRFAVHAAL